MTKRNVRVFAEEEVASLVHRMREDWNGRALDDARYFVAFGQRRQSDEGFNATAADAIRRIRRDFHWLAQHTSVRSRRILEIGCGVGRLMRNLSEDCGEIHGVDISDEMIRLGHEWLAGIPHAHLHVTTESDLRAFASDSFDVVYSYAVMQHLPGHILFWRYLHEAFRVLKVGGILVAQFNGMAPGHSSPDTWTGITVPAKDVAAACRAARVRVRSLEGEDTQYVWITAQKADEVSMPAVQNVFDIDEVTGAENTLGTVIAGGPDGIISLIVRGLPNNFCDLNELTLQIGSSNASINYVGGANPDGQRQINALVSDDTPLGTMPVRLLWRNLIVSSPYLVRVNMPSPPSPRILMVTDGKEVGCHNVVYCGWAKIWITDLLRPDVFKATVAEIPVSEMEFFCEDSRARRYQINLRVPEQVPAGVTDLVVYVSDSALPAVRVSIACG